MERLAVGPVNGDGGFIFALEKRGFVKVRNWQKEIVACEKRTQWQISLLNFVIKEFNGHLITTLFPLGML